MHATSFFPLLVEVFMKFGGPQKGGGGVVPDPGDLPLTGSAPGGDQGLVACRFKKGTVTMSNLRDAPITMSILGNYNAQSHYHFKIHVAFC